MVRSYFISCSPLEGGKAFSHSVTESNITLTELHPFYTYECRVAAVTIGIGPYTAKYEFKMSPATPSSPAQNISFVPINSSSVLVAWGPIPECPEWSNLVLCGFGVRAGDQSSSQLHCSEHFSDGWPAPPILHLYLLHWCVHSRWRNLC